MVRLVCFDGQHIVRAGGHNLACNDLLAAHRVDGDDGALEQQGVEQLRDGRDLVALLGCADPSEHHAQSRAIRRDQVYRALTPIV